MRRILPCLLAPPLLLVALACGGGSDAPNELAQDTTCETIATVAGPEDLVVDPSTTPPRLLISSRNLDDPRSTGDGIFAVPLTTDGGASAARALPLAGRDGCSFHPHGISLVRAEEDGTGETAEGETTEGETAEGDTAAGETGGPWLLYVINHHEPGEASPTEGCLPASPGGERAGTDGTSIEVFRVEPRRLVFVQRLAAPSILTWANDLVALPDGQIWITTPPLQPLRQARETLFGSAGSRVVHFACAERTNLRCTGRWRVAWTGGRYVNGVAHAPAQPEGTPERLFVASSADGTLRTFRVTTPGHLEEGPTIDLTSAPDNLTWVGTGRRALLTAGHPDLRRFWQHSLRHETPSPSQVVRIPVDGSEPPETLFSDDGTRISAASTALCFDGDLILGQVFGAHVLRCRLGAPCAERERSSP